MIDITCQWCGTHFDNTVDLSGHFCEKPTQTPDPVAKAADLADYIAVHRDDLTVLVEIVEVAVSAVDDDAHTVGIREALLRINRLIEEST